jgi:acetylornithine deacetylase/succinyl-diaminopimelate desuccinylase-like protein
MFDRRLLPGDDPAHAIEQMKEAIGTIEPFEIEVQPRDFMYPSEVAKDAEVVQVLEQGIRTMLNYEPKFSYSTAANDTGLFNHRGIQAINYGSRDIRFQHTDHDLVALNNVFNAAKVFAFLGIHR